MLTFTATMKETLSIIEQLSDDDTIKGVKMNEEMGMMVRTQAEREALRNLIAQWNANRLDLFALSEPNEDLEFHGVMRFYFQDSGQKVATKCIRVASDATTPVVIETLIEKFRPDMRMLSVPEYALYEIHENGEERRLGTDEKPLLVQLNWHKDDREGRFLLRGIDDKTNYSQMPEGTFKEASSFKRKLSKREKKQLKKQEKLNRIKSNGTNDENDAGVAEKLYTELPETSFTRSISNPEAVMRRRRQQILERKLQQFRSKDGGPDTGGTLKIYGEALCKDVPYKTLLLSVGDTAAQVVKEMLLKYGLEKEDPHNYCLVQVNSAMEDTKEANHGNNNTINTREYILDEDECPLAILMNAPLSKGSIMFHVRRRPADYHPRKRKKKPQQGKWGQQQSTDLLDYRHEDDRLPFLLELNPDGSEMTGGCKRYRLQPNVTEVGSERGSPHGPSQSLQLFGPNIQPRHCVIAHTEGIVTVTPCSRDAETYVNGQRIYETTILQNGCTVKFGRIHLFRFLDPCREERLRNRHDSSRSPHDYSYDRGSTREDSSSLSVANGPTTTSTPSGGSGGMSVGNTSGPPPLNYETTFDVDGNVETRSTSSQGNKDDTRSQRSVSSSRDGNRLSGVEPRYGRGTDPILPAVLEIREETEEALLHSIITDLDPGMPGFKLAPAYTLYLAARYRASTHYRPELTPTERAHRLTLMLARVAAMIHSLVQQRYLELKPLALWLANASELLHFLKSDRHISAFSLDAQDTLADAVQIAFRHLVACLQGELSQVMPHFLSDRDDLSHDPEDSSTASVLGVLSNAMALLRQCRVNAALTIQLFSQLFHYVNVWAFNRIVAPNSGFCSRAWGLRLKARLAQIEVWAERQGLELAADCHLARVMQAAHLLQAPKYSCDDLATLSSTCFKLNSLQLRALLQRYQPTPDEPRIPHDMIDNVVRVAENLADELARSDGREVRLEEDPELALPFLLPEDGYSCEVVRGVPQGLVDFVGPLQAAGLCRLSLQPSSSGLWTVYMGPVNSMVRSPSVMSNRSGGFIPPQQEPEIQIIKLHKSNNGMGLSIVAAKGAGQDRLGIYIKSVVKGGAADADKRLQAGDQLLKVDGQSLVGITQEKAAEYLVRTGPLVTLEVAKQGAIYHGLATLLSQPSPVMGRVNGCEWEDNDWSYSERPGSPTVLRIPVPVIVTPPPPAPAPRSISANNLLSVPTSTANCYKLPPESNLQLEEDIFQQHQARLVNCDSEDALASLQRAVSHHPNRCDIVRFRRADTEPRWLCQSLECLRAPRGCLSRWVPLKETRQWKSDIYLTKGGQWEFVHQEIKNDTLSSSECSCESNTCSCSSGEPPRVSESEACASSGEEEARVNKLTPEEQAQALRELDEIVNDVVKEVVQDEAQEEEQALREISQIVQDVEADLREEERRSKPPYKSMHEFLDSMLKLDISSFKENNLEADSQPRKFSSSSSEECELEYGSGRVAALAKYFSDMGEAGIIRGDGGPRGKRRQRYRSEPDLSGDEGFSPKRGDPILPSKAFSSEGSSFATVLKGGLRPVGFSMDRLVDLGKGVVMRVMQDVSEVKRGLLQKPSHAKIEDVGGESQEASTQTVDAQSADSNTSKSKAKAFNWRNRLTNSKSISVDEIELKRQAHTPRLLRHYSLVDLNHVDSLAVKLDELKLLPKPTQPIKQDKFLPSEAIHKMYMGHASKLRRGWVSVDETRTPAWSERKEKLDLGSKDVLRKLHKADTIRGRRTRRMKKMELQRSFVVTPVRFNKTRSESADHGLKWLEEDCDNFRRTKTEEDSCWREEEPVPCRPRRMSERDLPSRILNEQQNNMAPRGMPMQPTHLHMSSSKSVPSLNTGASGELDGRPLLNQTVAGGAATMPRPNHEVFNPGYSRTSSTNSIPQKAYDNSGGQYPPNQVRSRSSQNLHDNRGMPNNQGLGGRQPSNPNLGPGAPMPQQGSHHPGHYNYHQPQMMPQAHMAHHGMMSPPQGSPGGMDNGGERFYQNLSVYRNHEVHNGFIPNQHPQMGRGKMPSPQEENRLGQVGKNLRGSQSSLGSRATEPAGPVGRDRPASAYLLHNHSQAIHNHIQSQALQARSQSSRDMLRQEAKIQEMTEEVRRREMRVTSPIHHRPPPGNQRYVDYPGGRITGGEYSESPPPPPPPPTSTHPLYQPGSAPPRGGYYQTQPGQPGQPGPQGRAYGSNPWAREEREREAERRKEATRMWRDQQIAELTSLPSLTPQQEHQLRALKLEREFERRAEELEEEEDEDTEGTGLLRVAGSQPPPPQMNGRPPLSPTSYSHVSAEEKARLQRLKELKMKQAEVEAERMKKKQQEEEMRNQANSRQGLGRPPTSSLRLENLVVSSPASPYSNNNGYSPGQGSPAGQRLDNLVGGSPGGSIPPPPERGSSFAVMSQALRSPPPVNSSTSTPASTGKRVSFQDPPPIHTPNNNTAPISPLDNVREDPNRFINEAENMLASPTSPDTTFTGNTPGVIGAQEVYKDPRQKRLQEQQQNQKLKGPSVPEKMSFKEKMKMFAMETGEEGTPKDKVKISRAQRDIDNIGSPGTPNNNGGVSSPQNQHASAAAN